MSESVLQSAMFLLRELVSELAALHEKVDHLRQEVKQGFVKACAPQQLAQPRNRQRG